MSGLHGKVDAEHPARQCLLVLALPEAARAHGRLAEPHRFN